MLDRRRVLMSFAAAGVAAQAGCATAPFARRPAAAGAAASDPAVKAQADALYERMFEELLRETPEGMTSLGLDAAPEGAWAKSRLDDRSAAGVARQAAMARGYFDALKSIDRSRLHGMDAVNYDTMMFTGEVGVEGYERFAYGSRGFPQAYVLNQLNTALTSVPDFLDSQHRIETAADAEAYLERVAAFADALDQETARAVDDARRGAAPPDFVIDRTLAIVREQRAAPAAQGTLVRSVARRTAEKGIAGDWAGRAERLVTQRVQPAMDRQIAALEAMRPGASSAAGVWRLPDGEAYFQWGLRYYTTTGLSAAEIHRMGREQVADLSARIDALFRGQGMTQGTTGQRLSALAKDPRFLYPNTDEGKAKLLGDLNRQIDAMDALLPKVFRTLAKADVEVRRVPPAIEAGAPGGYYQSPSLDGSRPGAYYINLRDTAEWPSWQLPTLTYHEANPGHHWQITIALEAEGIPMIRRVSGNSAYSEGWALYAEQLADELGVYETDPWGRIGYLQSFLFRAVRLVVDTGLHAQRWTREQAVAYMTEHLGEPESSHVTEVERYCVWPGQACSYKVGQTVWLNLREEARAKLGPRFDVKGFHDAGLTSGAMPMAVLERVIRDWAAGV